MTYRSALTGPAGSTNCVAAAHEFAIIRRSRVARVDLLRTLCILCIVFLHFPMFNAALIPQQSGMDWAALEARSAFSNGFLYMALPTLALISGYVAWRPGVDVRYGVLIRKKFWAIVVPMLIWNGVVLVASFAAQSKGYVSGVRIKLENVDARLIIEALTGLTRNPVNYPLHFLRDLFVLFALWPVWAWLIRRAPMLGLALVTVVFIFNVDGNLVRRDTMAVTFYIGLLFGSRTWDICFLDHFKWPALCCLAMLAATQIWLGIQMPGRTNLDTVSLIVKLMAPGVIWSAAGLLEPTWLGRKLTWASTFSFPIFLMHAPMLQVEYRLMPAIVRTDGSAHTIAWLAASAITVPLCVLMCVATRRWLPRTASFVFGGRR